MNVTGTERQRAVIAAFKVKPTASYPEIASAAGVTVIYAGLVVRDYLKSRAHDQSLICQSPTRQTLSVVKDVAVFQVARRSGCTLAGATAKQQAVQAALTEHPQQDGEGKTVYCKRIAAIAGVHYSSIFQCLKLKECEAIGAAVRAREAEEAKSKIEVMPPGLDLGPVVRFGGWIDTFARFKAAKCQGMGVRGMTGDGGQWKRRNRL